MQKAEKLDKGKIIIYSAMYKHESNTQIAEPHNLSETKKA